MAPSRVRAALLLACVASWLVSALAWHGLQQNLGGGGHHFPDLHGDAASATKIPCSWTDPVSGHSWDLTSLMLPGSSYLFRDTMTDEEHDSVHAHHDPPAAPLGRPSGRMLDQKKTTGSAAAEEKSPKERVRHFASNDEYDFWVNVCTPSVGMPAVCDNKEPSAGYQVVVPKELDEPDEEDQDYQERTAARERRELLGEHERDSAEDTAAREAQRKASIETSSGFPKSLHRHARAAPVPTECHSLGTLKNASWSVITTRDLSHGVSLRYSGGDSCLKRVTSKPPPPSPKGKKGVPGLSTADSFSPSVSWVPVPRSLTLHIRCDESDPGAHDFASFMQLSRRVRVVETEMCEYVVEWPSKLGCSKPPRAAALRVAGALVHPRRAPWWILLAALAALGVQMKRQWPAVRLLLPALNAGDRAAWRRLRHLLLSKEEHIRRARPAYAKAGHEV